MPDILQKLVIAQKPKQAKQALKLLLAVADEAIVPVAVVRSGKIVPNCTPASQTRCPARADLRRRCRRRRKLAGARRLSRRPTF